MKNVQKKVPSLALIITLVGFPQISESIFTPILPALSQALNVNANQIQLTMSIYFIAFAIGVLFWGQLADYCGRRPSMLGGIIIYLIGNIGLYWSPSFKWLLFFRLVQAFGASAGSVVTQTIMRESFSGITGTKVFAKTGAAMALSPAFGPLIGGLVQTTLGYRNVFTTLISLAVVILLYSGIRLPETRQKQPSTLIKVSQWLVLKQLLSNPVVWCYGLVIGGINGILFSYYAEAPFIFEGHFNFSAFQYGLLGLIIASASLLGALIVNHLVNRYRPEIIAFSGLVLSTISAVGLLVAATVDQPAWMLAGIFFVFLGLNITLPNALNRALIGYEQIMGSANGWFSLGYYLVVSGLTYLMSLMHNGSITSLPLYILGLSLMMLISYAPLIKLKEIK